MKPFGKLLTGVGIFAASIASVSAADLPGGGEPPVYDDAGPSKYRYDRPAIGWNGFYLGGHIGSATGDADTVGAVGLHAGFNWQNPSNFVMGIEGEYTGLDAVDADALASIRGKLGVVYGKSLIYATAGVGFLDAETAGDDVEAGFAAGIGFDYKFTPSTSFGLDVSYYNFDDLEDINGDDDLDVITTYARLTFHLNGGYSDGYK